MKQTVSFDGLGRKTVTSVAAPEGTINTKQTYDAMGRPFQISNPALGTPSNFTTSYYDGLGRAIQVVATDGATTKTCYAGSYTLTRDPNEVNRQNLTDGLGRLREVQENVSSWMGVADLCTGQTIGKSGFLTYTTTYGYDEQDNLTSVAQGGQIRSFGYNSLKQLSSATNPESGTITYNYDTSGNLTSKMDARVTTTYAYDGMNRVIRRSYSDATPVASFCYDGSPSAFDWLTSTQFTCTSAFSVTGPKTGKLTYEGNSNSNTQYTAFTPVGRVQSSVQTTAGAPLSSFSMSYTYSLAGGMTSITYPSGRTATTTYDQAGRIHYLDSQKQGGASLRHADISAYTPFGVLSTVTFNNGLVENRYYNTRQQLTGVQATVNGFTPLGLTYYYTASNVYNSGNVMRQLITATNKADGYTSQVTYDQYFTYDGFNRLYTAYETTTVTSQSYGYDQYGNRWVTGYVPAGAMTPQSQSAFNAANNRFVSAAYDTSGNQTSYGARTLAYDGDNRQVSVSCASPCQSATYSYDAAGRRVQSIVQTPTYTNAPKTTYVYDASGNLVAEYSDQNTPSIKALAGTVYRVTDALGSTRLTADMDGGTLRRYDYLPFGEELLQSRGQGYVVSGHAVYGPTQRFTGKERDAETGLDYFGARYFSGAQGRFTSPDEFTGGPYEAGASRRSQPGPLPYADISNPQSLNKYAYALNNPLRYIDPDGHEVVLAGSKEDQEEAEKRILANIRKSERALFTTVTGKDGKTRLVVDKQAAASFEGKQSKGYNMLVQTLDSKKTATVVMDNMDSRTAYDGRGNATVYLNRDVAGIDRVAPMRDRQGNLVPNPFSIIAAHELLGHARLYMLGIVPGAYYDGPGSRTFQTENVLRKEQGLPPRPDEVP